MSSLSAVVPATDRAPALARCRAAIAAAAQAPEEVLVVREPAGQLPAAARNAGARRATGDVLVFVDSDVLVRPDAFVRIRRAFSADPGLTALFGAYDDAPAAPGAVSGFRYLLHHHVHGEAAGAATTFWSGLGAVRRDAFLDAGGFDPARRWIEDVELGLRLSAAGARIRLDPEIQGTHLKALTLREMVAVDVWGRGVPWVGLMLDRRELGASLNLGARHRAAAGLAAAAAAAAALRRPRAALTAVAGFAWLHRRLYALVWRRRGPAQAAAAVPLHLVHSLAAGVAVPLGVATWAARRARIGAS